MIPQQSQEPGIEGELLKEVALELKGGDYRRQRKFINRCLYGFESAELAPQEGKQAFKSGLMKQIRTFIKNQKLCLQKRKWKLIKHVEKVIDVQPNCFKRQL